jgi:radical SAM protein with 4Fe4S-binding SPASM domain
MRFAESLNAPSWVVLQLVEECNLRCTMCYEWGESGAYHHKRPLASLDLDVALHVIRECLPAKPYFELFGGEPLLHAGIWDVIGLIRAGGCEVAFPTNGTLVERCAERLVAAQPNRIWISLDGPEPINDAQRGRGVFRQVLRGLDALTAARRRHVSRLPAVGITCVVTPNNHRHLEELFLETLDLSQIDYVSIELQSYATEAQYGEYTRMLREEFGVLSASYARAYVRDPAFFAEMDREALAGQMQRIRSRCGERGIRFFSQPRQIDAANLDRYLRGDWAAMPDRRPRCAVPWACAEVSARGDVTTCHTFYDSPIGNVHEQPLLEIWRGDRAKQFRSRLRDGLLPICTACCRYYQ